MNKIHTGKVGKRSRSRKAENLLTEKELREYTHMQEKVLKKLKNQFHEETEFPYSVVETEAEKLLSGFTDKVNKFNKAHGMKELPMSNPTKKGIVNTKFIATKAAWNWKQPEPEPIIQIINNRADRRRAQSIPRKWKGVNIPIGLSTSNPSTEVNFSQSSSRSSLTTMDSLPSEASSGFYDQYSVNKYWQDGMYQKSVQPHFFLENKIQYTEKNKTNINKNLVRPWPVKKSATQESFLNSRPRTPLRITQPGRQDCSAFNSIESRDKFLASLPACPIITPEIGNEPDIKETTFIMTDDSSLLSPISSSYASTVCSQCEREILVEVEEVLSKSTSEVNNNFESENLIRENALESYSGEDRTLNTKDLPIQTTIPPITLTLALIPLPWYEPGSCKTTEEKNNNAQIQNQENIQIPEPESEVHEKKSGIQPVGRKVRSICSIVPLPGATNNEIFTSNDQNGNIIGPKLTSNQSRLMMEIDLILSSRINRNLQSTNSSKPEISTPSNVSKTRIMKILNAKVEPVRPKYETKSTKAVLLPSEKQMLSRLSDIFRRFDYDNTKNIVNAKLRRTSPSKSKINANLKQPVWPEWKFDASLFPKADNLIAEAKSLVKSSDMEVNTSQEPGTEFLIGKGVQGKKLWVQKANTLPGWFRKVPQSLLEGRSLTSNSVKRKDDVHPGKFNLFSKIRQNKKAPELKDPLNLVELRNEEDISDNKVLAGNVTNTSKSNLSSNSSSFGPNLKESPTNLSMQEKSSRVENPKFRMKRKMLLKKLSDS